MRNLIRTRVKPEEQYGSRTAGETLHGWNRNTNLCCDLKTFLHDESTMKPGKEYQGMLRCDADTTIDDYLYQNSHFTFVETLPSTEAKRNPHVFRGKYLTVTRRDDGSLRPNFKPMQIDEDFTVEGYALGVMNELRQALTGLIEK